MHPIGLYLAAADIERRRGDDRRDRRVVFAAVDALPLDETPQASRRQRLEEGIRALVVGSRRVVARVRAPLRGQRRRNGADTRI